MSHYRPAAGTSGPVEEKVRWATIAATLVTFVTAALANAIRDPDHGLLLAGLPEWLEPIVLAAIAGLPTFWAGWQARHTHRPDLHGPLA